MKLGPSRRGSVVLPAMIALMVTAVVSFALAGQRIAPAPHHVRRHAGDVRHDDAEGRDAERVGDAGGHDPVPGSTGTRGGPSTDLSEACAAAVSGGEAAVEAATGLRHAIDVLLTNCQRNDEAQGLVQALQRLQDADGRDGRGHEKPGHGHDGGSRGARDGKEDHQPSPHGPNGGASD